MKAFCAYNDVLNVMQKNIVCNINNEIKQYFRDLEFISLLSEVEEQKV